MAEFRAGARAAGECKAVALEVAEAAAAAVACSSCAGKCHKEKHSEGADTVARMESAARRARAAEGNKMVGDMQKLNVPG